MARNFNGGTDRLGWVLPLSAGGLQTVAVRFRTTQTTANVQFVGYWNGSNRNGFGITLNESAGKMRVQAWDNSTFRLAMVGATTVNDGNWHTLIYNGNASNGGANTLYIDGVQDVTQNSSAQWGAVTNNDIILGDSVSTFWAEYVGDYADFGFWNGANLTADEIAAYNKGFSARHFQRSTLQLYAPLVRDHQDRLGRTVSHFTGTTVADHPRVIGSLI